MSIEPPGFPSLSYGNAVRRQALDAHVWLLAAGIEVTGSLVAKGFAEIACFVDGGARGQRNSPHHAGATSKATQIRCPTRPVGRVACGTNDGNNTIRPGIGSISRVPQGGGPG